MGFAATKLLDFTEYQCATCGCWYAVETYLLKMKMADREKIFCPNGCERRFLGETEAEKWKKEAERLRAERDFKQRQIEQRDKSLSAAKGQITKLKNRVGNGVCPCCNRSFENLARHMKCKHPEFQK